VKLGLLIRRHSINSWKSTARSPAADPSGIGSALATLFSSSTATIALPEVCFTPCFPFSTFIYSFILIDERPFAFKKFKNRLKQEHIGFLKGTGFESEKWIEYETKVKLLEKLEKANEVCLFLHLSSIYIFYILFTHFIIQDATKDQREVLKKEIAALDIFLAHARQIRKFYLAELTLAGIAADDAKIVMGNIFYFLMMLISSFSSYRLQLEDSGLLRQGWLC
jgi:hypothetical protein